MAGPSLVLPAKKSTFVFHLMKRKGRSAEGETHSDIQSQQAFTAFGFGLIGLRNME